MLRADDTIGGYCQGVKNQVVYDDAVIVSAAGAITYIDNQLLSTFVVGMPNSQSALGRYNSAGGFVYEGGVAYDLDQLLGGPYVHNVGAVNAKGQIVGQGASQNTNPGYILNRRSTLLP